MDKMTVNMIAGAVLSSLLVIFGMSTAIEILYPKGGEPEAPGNEIATANATAPGASAPAEADQPIAERLASADAGAGAKVAKKCAACHSFDKGGPNKVGPNLYGVVGRPIAGVDGFAYSPALQEKGGAWDFALLDCYLKDPKGCIPGNKMAFAGLKKGSDRADVIDYLRAQADSPEPLPTQ